MHGSGRHQVEILGGRGEHAQHLGPVKVREFGVWLLPTRDRFSS